MIQTNQIQAKLIIRLLRWIKTKKKVKNLTKGMMKMKMYLRKIRYQKNSIAL